MDGFGLINVQTTTTATTTAQATATTGRIVPLGEKEMANCLHPDHEVDLTYKSVLSYNYAQRIFLAVLAERGPEDYQETLLKYLESCALLSAFAGAFLSPLERDVYENDGYYAHLTVTSCTQAVSLWTVIMSVMAMTQMSFWGPREMGKFTTNFYVFLFLPLIGCILTLMGAMVAVVIQSYALADPEDNTPWHVTLAFSSFLSLIAVISYPYMDRITRATRFKQLRHEHTPP
jgi:hypothetical protein